VRIELEGERLVGFENLTRIVLRLSRYFGRPRDSARSQEVCLNEPRSVWRGSNVECEKDPEPQTAYPSAPQTGFPFRRPRACEARRNFNASRCNGRVAGQTFESCLNQSLPVDLCWRCWFPEWISSEPCLAVTSLGRQLSALAPSRRRKTFSLIPAMYGQRSSTALLMGWNIICNWQATICRPVAIRAVMSLVALPLIVRASLSLHRNYECCAQWLIWVLPGGDYSLDEKYLRSNGRLVR